VAFGQPRLTNPTFGVADICLYLRQKHCGHVVVTCPLQTDAILIQNLSSW
jgi:hypothetical protein